jgi:hypothetical protein
LSEEIKTFREKWSELERRIANLFDRVRPESPWWFWFERDGERFVHQVVQDGSGNLWVMKGDRGEKLFEWLVSERVKVLCAVKSWEEQ